jgi:hypothetical protein
VSIGGKYWREVSEILLQDFLGHARAPALSRSHKLDANCPPRAREELGSPGTAGSRVHPHTGSRLL